MIQRRTVGIVGTGHVGAAAAFAIFQQRLASDLILVDKNEARAEGEALDLLHGQLFAGRTQVRGGSYEDLAEAQVVVITAGVAQKDPSESRLELLNRNAEVFRQITAELDRHAPQAILVVATNPVDVLTYLTQELSERPHERVFGTGTLLDTARFRALLGEHYDVDPQSVHAYILGEHGDSEVPVWSQADIGGTPLRGREVLGRAWDEEEMQQLFERARGAAQEIIERKGYTSTAIGLVIAQIVRAALSDGRTVLPLSIRLHGAYDIDDVCLSVPCVVRSSGALDPVLPELDEGELEALRESARVLKEAREGIALLERESG